MKMRIPIAEICEARRRSAQMIPSRRLDAFKVVNVAQDRRCVDNEFRYLENSIYCVTKRHFKDGSPLDGGEYILLGINSKDQTARHDWRDFQTIKNLVVGEEWEGLELYPAESRLVDPSNYYMMWCFPKLPFGLHVPRTVHDEKTCIAPQRPWPVGGAPADLRGAA